MAIRCFNCKCDLRPIYGNSATGMKDHIDTCKGVEHEHIYDCETYEEDKETGKVCECGAEPQN